MNSLDAREFDDRVELPRDLGALHPHDRALQKDVLAAGQIGMEPGGDFDQRAGAALHLAGALGRPENLRQQLQRRRFAGAVGADDAERLARFTSNDTSGRPRTPVRPVRPGPSPSTRLTSDGIRSRRLSWRSPRRNFFQTRSGKRQPAAGIRCSRRNGTRPGVKTSQPNAKAGALDAIAGARERDGPGKYAEQHAAICFDDRPSSDSRRMSRPQASPAPLLPDSDDRTSRTSRLW